jgi:hypothetical protein
MNLGVFLVFCFYFYAENSYFGWNKLPMSDAEMLADGVGFIILALSFLKVRP